MRQKVAYGRVSTQQQADQGALERQEQALLEAAGADQVILDVGSGKTTSRPGYQRLLEMIGNGQVEQVLVADQDRLNRNLQADLELWGLCDANKTRITDLNGREIEFRSPDGELLSTVVSALNQHRSKAYGAKTRRGLEQARKEGLPARPRVPFGFRKVRNEQGRLVSIEPDPVTAPLARQRIDWFLSGRGLTGTCRLIGENHPRDTWMQPGQLKRWLKNPSLTGRLCWHKQGNSGEFAQVDAKPSFQGLISDSEAERVRNLCDALSTGRARAGRPTRTLSGLTRCAECKQLLCYKVSGRSTWYLRCSNPYCKHRNKCIRVDKTLRVLKGSMAMHCRHIAPLLADNDSEPAEVYELRNEIRILKQVKGTDDLIHSKEEEIQRILGSKNTYAENMLIAALADMTFWEKEEEELNSRLRDVVEYLQVEFGNNVSEARINCIKMKTSTAPYGPVLKGNQENWKIQMPGGIYWRRNADGTKEPLSIYRLPELLIEYARCKPLLDALGQIDEESVRRMSPEEHESLEAQMAEAIPFGIDRNDPSIEHEDVIWEYEAT